VVAVAVAVVGLVVVSVAAVNRVDRRSAVVAGLCYKACLVNERDWRPCLVEVDYLSMEVEALECSSRTAVEEALMTLTRSYVMVADHTTRVARG
jgi:hypothetical protein